VWWWWCIHNTRGSEILRKILGLGTHAYNLRYLGRWRLGGSQQDPVSTDDSLVWWYAPVKITFWPRLALGKSTRSYPKINRSKKGWDHGSSDSGPGLISVKP
jgi:hypothetical protein